MPTALLEQDTEELVDSTDGTITPRALSQILHLQYKDLAKMAGLKSSSLRASPKGTLTQSKLRPIAQVILRARAMTGSLGSAVAWFQYQPIPGFGNKTASQMVADGHVSAVLAHLDDLEEGVYA